MAAIPIRRIETDSVDLQVKGETIVEFDEKDWLDLAKGLLGLITGTKGDSGSGSGSGGGKMKCTMTGVQTAGPNGTITTVFTSVCVPV